MLLGCFSATILPIFALNLFLVSNTLGNGQLIVSASQWQEQSGGTTFAGGSGSGLRLFKTLRLLDRLPEINTVVLGSSTVMGITQKAFPEKYRIYNFATNGNPLSTVIGEADYIQEHFQNIKWFVVPLDWSLGFLYNEYVLSPVDLSLSNTLRKIKSEDSSIPLSDKIRDAVTYPKIVNLFKIIKSIFLAANKVEAFRENFLTAYGNEYACPDGGIAKDFDPMYRGMCSGFRFDGSATFLNLGRVGENVSALVRRSLDANLQYVKSLKRTNGVPNQRLLTRLEGIEKRARQNGGGVIFIRPPVLTGFEAELVRQPQHGAALETTRNTLDEWARQNHLTLIDAGQSEWFGCTPKEFVDAHHAANTCYVKIFDYHFSEQSDKSILINAENENMLLAPTENH